jgi:aspartate ammonia-lyase
LQARSVFGKADATQGFVNTLKRAAEATEDLHSLHETYEKKDLDWHNFRKPGRHTYRSVLAVEFLQHLQVLFTVFSREGEEPVQDRLGKAAHDSQNAFS